MSEQWYYAKGDEKLGPVTDVQLKELAANGELIPSDLVWRDGLSEWMPARRINGLFPSQVGPPPLSPSSASRSRTASRTGGAPKSKLSWVPAFVLKAVSFCFLSVMLFAAQSGEDEDAIVGLFLLWLVTALVATILMLILHYRYWAALPFQYRATTPGRAVGLLFVPFYNFYWVFVSYHGLATGYREYGHSVGDQRIADVAGLGLVLAILFIALTILAFEPGIGFLLGAADLVIYLLYSTATCANANIALAREGT